VCGTDGRFRVAEVSLHECAFWAVMGGCAGGNGGV
jgi:hypothetical protein